MACNISEIGESDRQSSIKSITMKSLLATLLVCIGPFMSAQQQSKTHLEIHSSLDAVVCENDATERNIVLEHLENNQKKTIGVYQSKGCEFSTSENLVPGNYTFTISGLNFEPQQIHFEITAENRERIVLDPVNLVSKNTELTEVTIFGNRRQYLKVESDKTTVNVKDNGMLNSGSTLDAVKRLPGVVASPVGGLTLNGKGVAIYMDGAPSSLTGTDLQNYLASLPAHAIEKVELIYNPGAAFDANSSGSVINIVTNSRKMKGVNASFNINYNFNKYQKPSPQILVNGKKDRLSWQTMTGYNYIDAENLTRTIQDFTSFSPVKTLTQENFAVQTFRNFYFRGGTNYKLNDQSNLLFNYNLNLGNDRTDNTATTVGENINFRNPGVSKTKSEANELSLQYKTKLDTLGRTLDITAYGNFFGKKPVTRSTSLENNTAATFNRGDVDFNLKNYYLKYDLAFPFEQMNFSVNTGGKFNTTQINDTGKYVVNSAPVNVIDFDYSETNLAFYAEARKKIRKFQLTAGLRFEDYKVKREASTVADKLHYDSTNFFPNLSALYEFNQNVNFTASYSKKIEQPGYSLIDPNSNSNFNKYNTSGGNLELKPVYFDNFEFKISAFQFMQIGANYLVLENFNQFAFTAEPGELISHETFISQDKTRKFGFYANVPIPLDYFFKGKEEFQKRMNAIEKMNYIMVNANYIKTTFDHANFDYPIKGNLTWNLQSQFILPWEITNSMSYFILPKGNWEIYRIEKPIQELDISFNRDFLNKNLKIGLHCFDIFNSNQVNALVSTPNLNTRFYQKQDSRTFRFSLTYNFGNQKLQKENTDINTDKVNKGGGGLK